MTRLDYKAPWKSEKLGTSDYDFTQKFLELGHEGIGTHRSRTFDR
jgi:hypothetical protein